MNKNSPARSENRGEAVIGNEIYGRQEAVPKPAYLAVK